MNHIVIDLEFDKISNEFRRKGLPTYSEIIEFGAVKLDENYNVTDRFQSFVKPEYISKISTAVENLTGITFADLVNAPKFVEVLADFVEWAGDSDIYAWSESDIIQIEGEMELKNITSSVLDLQWYDLQAIFDEKLGLHRRLSLENALSWMNIDMSGREHRAADDAFNTASILSLLNNEGELQQRFEPIHNFFEAPKTAFCTLGDLLGDALSGFCVAPAC